MLNGYWDGVPCSRKKPRREPNTPVLNAYDNNLVHAHSATVTISDASSNTVLTKGGGLVMDAGERMKRDLKRIGEPRKEAPE